MNKKFLSAVLFGALLASSTGTLTSCKDYDDDIDELWDAVNGQKSDLEGKVTALESTVSSLQSAQTDLQTEIADAKAAAAAAQNAADKAAEEAKVSALEAQEAAIAAAAKDLAAVKAELQDAIASSSALNQEAAEEALKAATEKAEAKMAEIVGSITTIETAYKGADAKILEKLANVETTLLEKITTLDKKVAENAKEIGKLQTALQTQNEALESYAKKTDVQANTDAIKSIQEKLGEYDKILKDLDAFDVEDTKISIEFLSSQMIMVSQQITTIHNDLELLSAAFYKGVTHISLYASSVNLPKDENPFDMNLVSAKADSTWIFGDKLPGAISFEKGKGKTEEKTFIIRVSPADANVTAENIKLINSKGEDLSGLVKVKDVKSYEGLLTRGISKNGLWEVVVAMEENYDEDAFREATQAKDENGDWATVEETNDSGESITRPKYILYAASWNTAIENQKGDEVYKRNVVSEYNLSFTSDDQTAAKDLKFTADKVDVTKISNRYDIKEDMKWGKSGPQNKPIFEGTGKKNVVNDTEDDRSTNTYKALPVVLNKPFTVELTDKDKQIAGFYVAIDYDRVDLTDDSSEKTAWKKYEKTIKGLNTVTTDGKIDITITDEDALTDVICFRVYAVNHNGKLVDPDGKAFEVVVGNAAEELSAYNVKKTWTSKDNAEISKAPVAEGVFGDWYKKVSEVAVLSADTVMFGDQKVDQAFTIKYYADKDAEGTEFTKFNNNIPSVGLISVDLADKNSPETGKIEDYWYDDNKTYSVTLAFKNEKGQTLKTLTVNYKKELPTFPSTFQAKVNQLDAAGTLNAFMAPVTTEGAEVTEGSKDLVQSFNGLKNGDTYDQNFVFTFADAKVDSKDNTKKAALEVKYNSNDNYTFKVGSDFIDNETKHAVTVGYNFGAISSNTKVTNGTPADYKVNGGEFKNIIFSCLAEINEYAWTKAPSLTYAQEDGSTLFSNIKATNKRDGKYTTTLDQLMTDAKDKMISDLSNAEFELWSQVAKDGAIKEGSKNEYFTPAYANDIKYTVGKEEKTDGKGIKFTPNSEAQNPEATVYSTLIIKAKDYFGHDAVIEIKNVEVKKR